MRHFLRALRFAWPYRGRFALSVICAGCVAILWGANITAVYPFLTLLTERKNLPEWATDQIAKSTREINEVNAKIDQLDADRQIILKWPAELERERARHLASLDAQIARLEAKSSVARSQRYWLETAKLYIDKFCPTELFNTLVLLLALVLAGVVLKGFFDFCQESLVGGLVYLTVFDLRNRLYRAALRMDVKQFTEEGTAGLLARFTNDCEALTVGIKILCGKLIVEPLKAGVCIVGACFVSWRLTVLFLIIVPLAFLLMSRVGRMLKRASKRVLGSMSSLYKVLHEGLVGIRLVKAYTAERHERRRLFLIGKDYCRKAQTFITLEAATDPIMEILGVAAVAGALLVGAYLVLTGRTELFGIRLVSTPLDPAALLLLYAQLVAIADPVRKLSNVFSKLQSAAAAADRIFEVMDRPPTIETSNRGVRLPRHASSIEFRGVCFSYVPGRPILTDVNFTVRAGERIAIVGRNGCGKSTLASLLQRFYDPDHGAILLDGMDLRAGTVRSLRGQIGIVAQETILFDDTIAANLRYGRRSATDAEVVAAAKRAHAHEFIAKLPHGYETRVGEMGNSLSGGQRQRLALARAILRDPAILILDEATSAADAQSEALINEALREFTVGRTTFLITHRLAALDIADRIILLEAGQVRAIGTHAELLASCPTYQRLYDAQPARIAA